MVGRLVVGWFVCWLVHRSNGRLVGWLGGRLVGWTDGWKVVWLVDLTMVDWLVGR